MSNGAPNPYAPPTETADDLTREIILHSLRELGPIPFRGSLTRENLNAYLRAYEHVGCVSMIGTTIILTFTSLVITLIVGEAAILVALGIVGFFALLLTTSTLPYRRSVFLNANPSWDAALEGDIAEDGVRVRQDGGESFFRWDWFERVVVGRQVLVLVPAIHPDHPIIVSASMLTHRKDADRIEALANDFAAAIQGTTETRRFNNQSLLRSSKRERTRVVGDGSIVFEGNVTSEDLAVLPDKIVHRGRPTRAYLLLGGLLVFPSLFLIGLGQISGLRVVLILFGITAIVSLVMRLLFQRRRSSSQGSHAIFYLTAMANDAGITSDFAVTVTTVPWDRMQQVYADETRIALSRGAVNQVIIARRDMFADDQAWLDFRALAEQNLS